MIFSRPALLLAASTICALVPCAAQETDRVKVRFVSFPKSDNSQPLELLVGDGETMPVNLPSSVISPVYTIEKPASWTLGKSGVDAEGNPSFEVYGTAPALNAREQLVLVVRNGKTDAEGFKLIPFDESGSGFGGGKYLFFNAASVDIACKIGDTKLIIKPLAFKLVDPKPSEIKNKREMLYVYLYFRKEKETNPFYSSTWRYSKKARTMVFMYHYGDNMNIRLHMIRDYLP